MATERPFQLVVFGASGFTGQYVVQEVARVAAEDELRGSLRWAVAGRSREKLQEVVEKAAAKLGKRKEGRSCGVRAFLLSPSPKSAVKKEKKLRTHPLSFVGCSRKISNDVSDVDLNVVILGGEGRQGKREGLHQPCPLLGLLFPTFQLAEVCHLAGAHLEGEKCA